MKAVGVQVGTMKKGYGERGFWIYRARAICRNLAERGEDTDRGSTVNYVFNA